MTLESRRFLLEHSNIPPRYLKLTFDDFDPRMKKWVDMAVLYVENAPVVGDVAGSGLYIVSPNDVGVGKSMLGCCILMRMIEQQVVKRQVTYYAFGDLMVALVDDARGQATDVQVSMLRRLRTSEVVMFDDFDKFSGTSNAVYRLHRIVGDLWDREVPLIVTTNLMPSQLVDRLVSTGAGEDVAKAIVSRVRGMTDLWKIDFGGKVDFRLAVDKR